MKQFFRYRSTEWIIVILLFCLCNFFFTLVLDDYGSFAYLSLPGLQFSDFPHIEHCYNSFIGINSIYVFLYDILPTYNWMGIAFMAQTLLSLYFILNIIRWKILKNISSIFVIIGIQLLFAVLFIDNIITLSHTRFSLLFCGIALFNLAFTQRMSKWNWILNGFLFLLGMLHRPESSIGMLVLTSFGVLMYSFDFKRWFLRFLLPISATFIFFTIVTYDWHHTNIYVKKIEPEIEYKMMDKRVVSLDKMKTATDSVKYEAALIGMWFDTKEMSPDFLRSMQLSGIELNLQHATATVKHVWSLYQYYALASYILIALMFVCFFIVGKGRVVIQIIVFQFLTFALIFALDYNGKLVAGRHFLNVQIVALLFSFFYFFDNVQNEQLKHLQGWVIAIALLLVSIGAIITTNNYLLTNTSMAADIICYENAMQNFETQYSNRLVIVNVSNYRLFDHGLTIKNKRYSKNKYILFDLFNYSLTPMYQSYLNNKCQCNNQDPSDFFAWLSKQKALYISKSYRRDLTQKYMNIVHHFPLHFTPVNSLNKSDCITNTYMQEFSVAEVGIN